MGIEANEVVGLLPVYQQLRLSAVSFLDQALSLSSVGFTDPKNLSVSLIEVHQANEEFVNCLCCLCRALRFCGLICFLIHFTDIYYFIKTCYTFKMGCNLDVA
jgi:hypothetical protein